MSDLTSAHELLSFYRSGDRFSAWLQNSQTAHAPFCAVIDDRRPGVATDVVLCVNACTSALDEQGCSRGPKVAVTPRRALSTQFAASFRQASLRNYINSFLPDTMQVCLPPSWLLTQGSLALHTAYCCCMRRLQHRPRWAAALLRPFSNLPPTARGLNRLCHRRA